MDSDQQESKKDTLVEGLFKVDYIPSVNSQYLINNSRKFLDPKIREDRQKIWYQLSCCGYKRDAIPKDIDLIIEIGFYLIKNINRRDLDNMLKNTIDVIAKYFDFNDVRIYNLACYKRLVKNSEKELIFFRIKKFVEKKSEKEKIDLKQNTSEVICSSNQENSKNDLSNI